MGLNNAILSGASALSRDWTQREESVKLLRLAHLLSNVIVFDGEGLGVVVNYTSEDRPIVKSDRGIHSREWSDLKIINLEKLYETFTAE